jgi:hypothetical protein
MTRHSSRWSANSIAIILLIRCGVLPTRGCATLCYQFFRLFPVKATSCRSRLYPPFRVAPLQASIYEFRRFRLEESDCPKAGWHLRSAATPERLRLRDDLHTETIAVNMLHEELVIALEPFDAGDDLSENDSEHQEFRQRQVLAVR